MEVKKRYAGRIVFEVGVQPLQGVLDPASYEQYAEACKLADYCGGLPSRDRPRPEAHLDLVLDLAKRPAAAVPGLNATATVAELANGRAVIPGPIGQVPGADRGGVRDLELLAAAAEG